MLQLYPSLCPVETADMYLDILGSSEPVTALNVVTTVDGRAAMNGRSFGIGSRTDQALLRHIRSLFDAVLHGTGTLRKEGVDPGLPAPYQSARRERGQNAEPLTVVLAGRSGAELPGRMRRLQTNQLILFSSAEPASGQPELSATSYRTPGIRPDPGEVVDTLRRRHGVKNLLIEGGPSINASFLSAGLVDTIFWTVAPKLLGGGDAPGMFSAAQALSPVPLKLVSIVEDDGELFLRYLLTRPIGQ